MVVALFILAVVAVGPLGGGEAAEKPEEPPAASILFPYVQHAWAADAPAIDAYVPVSSLDVGTQWVRNMAFSDDGSTMVAADQRAIAGRLAIYDLSTPYDLSSATSGGHHAFAGNDFQRPEGVAFSSNGTLLYVSFTNGGEIHAWSLSDPYNVTSALTKVGTSDFGSATDPRGIAFSEAGDKLFVAWRSNSTVNEYSLSTPWSVLPASVSYVRSLNVSGTIGTVSGVDFIDGTRMLVAGGWPAGSVAEYRLSAPYDLSGATLEAQLSLDASPTGMAAADGKVFVMKFQNQTIAAYGPLQPSDSDFVTTWTVPAGSLSVRIPAGVPAGAYNIDWGDGNHSTGVRGGQTHTYASAGDYQIRISGDFERITLSHNSANAAKLKSIDQWGDIRWSSMGSAFQGASNVVSNATDAPDLSRVTDMSNMFRFAAAFNGNLSAWNTSSVTHMNNMFWSAPSFNSDISGWDVSSVTNMQRAFSHASAFTSDLSDWNVSSVTNMQSMFNNADSFTSDLSDWNVSSVTNMQSMFNGADVFNSDISEWDTSSLTRAAFMFSNADVFNSDISKWDVSKATDMRSMFDGADAFSQNLGPWYVQLNTTALRGDGEYAASITQQAPWLRDNHRPSYSLVSGAGCTDNDDFSISGGVLQLNDNAPAQDSYAVCIGAAGASLFGSNNAREFRITDPAAADPDFVTTWRTTAANQSITIPVGGSTATYDIDWGDGNVQTGVSGNQTHQYAEAGNHTVRISGNFERIHLGGGTSANAARLMSIDNWGDIQWKSMEYAFNGASFLTYNATDAPDLSRVSNMSGMFALATNFDGDISGWDTSSVTDMNSMFVFTEAFNSDLSRWDTSSVTDMNRMFLAARAFNSDLSRWNTSSVTLMYAMFSSADAFDGDISGWDTSSVTDMDHMFSDTHAFNGDISRWNTSSVTSMASMFENADAFDGDISRWNTSGVTDMTEMFRDADAFNGNISGWNVSQVASMDSMFRSASAFNGNISGWDTSGVTNMNSMFLFAGAFDRDISGWDVSFVTDMQFMLSGAASFSQNLGPWYIQLSDTSTGANGAYAAAITQQAPWLRDNHRPAYSLADNSTYPDNANFTISGNTLALKAGAPVKPMYVVGIEASGSGLFGGANHAREFQISGTTAFVTTWHTTIANETIKIPVGGATGTYDIDWGDGTIDTGVSGDQTHKYAEAGNHTVGITGNFERIYLEGGTSANAEKLMRIDNWGDIQWKSMGFAFSDATSMTYGATDAPDLSRVSNMSYMFLNAQSFDGDLSAWDTSGVTDMSGMFNGATAFNSSLSGWNTSSVTDMSDMFVAASSFNGSLSGWNTSSVTYMDHMFAAASSFNGDISGWNTSSVTDMSLMFSRASSFNGSLSGWNTSSVTYMDEMFSRASQFNGSLSRWDTSSVTNMRDMFNGADVFNGNVSGWDTSSVTNMNGMFRFATSFNGNVSGWDTSGVTDMSGMFQAATSFNGDLSGWDTSSVTNMGSMFQETAFNGNISDWNTSNVTNVVAMFAFNSAFNGDISGWDVSQMILMGSMFHDAPAFSQDLGPWYIQLNDTSVGADNTYAAAITQQAPWLRDNHRPAYSLADNSTYPDNANFTISSGVLSIKAGVPPKPAYAVVIEASGNGLFGGSNHAREFRIAGTDPPPTPDAGPGQTVDELATVVLDGSGSSHPGGDAISYEWTAPDRITLRGANTSAPSFTAPPVVSDTDFAITLTVSDGRSSDTDTVTVTVRDAIRAPDAPNAPGLTTLDTNIAKRTVEINSRSANGPALVDNALFGSSAASLGDLDGDGMPELAVGAHNDGLLGAVHVVFINDNGTAKRTVEINGTTPNGPSLANNDAFGTSAASLGDLDGDGIPELAVGAYGDDAGGPQSGAVHIMFMNADGTIKRTAEINGTTPNGPSLSQDDRFGASAASLGDLDGDGVPELAVGSPHDDAGGDNRGAVHVMFMNANGTIKRTAEINDLTPNGPVLSNNTQFGSSVASLGDLDGDDVPDMAVGSPEYNAGGDDRGAVHILFMNSNGTIKRTAEINGTTPNGPVLADYDYFGASAASLGDLDGDGVPELAVGAYGDDAGGERRGAVHVIFMNADGTPKRTAEINGNTENGPRLGNGDAFGASAASLGDLDGDGVPDMAIGATWDDAGGANHGAVHVVFVNTEQVWGLNVKRTAEINDFTANGPHLSNDERFGSSAASLDDLDGDGLPELVVGADGRPNKRFGSSIGAVHTLFMNASGTVKSTESIDITVRPFTILERGDYFGSSVASLGDLDGDGVPDMAIGAEFDDSETTGAFSSGTVYIRFLNADGSTKSITVINDNTTNGPSLAQDDYFGSSAASLGDLDGDGLPELAVGATGDDSTGRRSGAVHVMFMNADGTIKRTVEINGTTPNGPSAVEWDLFGSSVASLGDLDGDGIPDMAVGAYGVDVGIANSGAVHVIFMKSDGTPKSTVEINDLTPNGPVLFNRAYFGSSVTSLGDLDGDGVPELAVGAIGELVYNHRGAVHVLFLRADGTVKDTVVINDNTPNGPRLSNSDNFGSSAASMGDFDGDGFPELAVGAHFDDAGGVNNGAVHVIFLGGIDGVYPTVKGAVLNETARTLTVQFSEAVSAPGLDLGRAFISEAGARDQYALAGSSQVLSPDGTSATVTLPPALLRSALSLGAPQLDVAKGALSDASGNEITISQDNPVAVVRPADPSNLSPVADAGPDQRVFEGSTVRLDGSGSSDPDGNAISYAWTVSPSVALLNADTDAPSFAAPSVRSDTNYTLTLTVSDGFLSDTDTVTVTVRDRPPFNPDPPPRPPPIEFPNSPPVADAGLDQTVFEGDTVRLDGSVSSDPDGGPISYAWTASPSVTIQNATTVAPSFTAPAVTSDTNYTLTLTVTDDARATDTDTVVVTVQNVNRAPSADAGPDQTVDEGDIVTLNGSGSSDPDEDAISYAWTAPQGITLQKATAATPTFTAPQVSADTPYTFTLTVSDGSLSDTDTVTVTVRDTSSRAPPTPPPPPPPPPNASPVADAGDDQTVDEGSTVTLDGSGSSDPDGSIVSYAWDAPQGVTLQNGNTAAPSFTAPQVSADTPYVFTLTVTDDDGATGTDTVTITVRDTSSRAPPTPPPPPPPPPNASPFADAGDDQTVDEGSTVTLDGSGSSDLDGSIVSYAWAAPQGVTLQNGNTAHPSFTAPNVTSDTDYTFRLRVTDNRGATDTDRVTITVRDTNRPPVADAGQLHRYVPEGSTVTLNGQASYDPEGGPLSYEWAVQPSSGITLRGANTSTPSFTAPAVNASTLYDFTLTVSDDAGAASSDVAFITVWNVLAPPVADAGPDQTVRENSTVTLNGSASHDPGFEPISHSWAPADPQSGITLRGASTSAPSFTAPAVSADTVYTFTLTVTDINGNADTDTVAITVRDADSPGTPPPARNSPPVAHAGPDQTVPEGATVTLNGSASHDPDGDPLTYAWTAPAGIALDNASARSPSFTAPAVSAASNYDFELAVSDGTDTATDSVTVTVWDSPDTTPPAPAAPSNLAVSSATADTVTISWDDPADPTITGYRILYRIPAAQPALVTLVNDTGTANTSYAAAGLEPATTYEFAVAALNGSGASAVSNIVTASTAQPAAGLAPEDVTVVTLHNATITDAAVSPDGSVLIIAASSGSNGSVLAYDLPVRHDPASAVPRDGGMVTIPPEYGAPTSVTVSPDGTRMLVTTTAPSPPGATATSAPPAHPPAHAALFSPAPHPAAPHPASSHTAPARSYVLEYLLSTPFDISTASLSPGAPARLSSTALDSPAGAAFSGNGTMMYIALPSQAGGGFILSYALSTPFDASSSSPAAALTVPPSHGAISDVAISADGAVMLVTASPAAGPAPGAVLSYALRTPFDLSSATRSPDSSVPIPAAPGAPVGAAFFGADGRSALVAATAPSAVVPAPGPAQVSLPPPPPLAMAPVPPAAPENLAATSTDDSVTLSWDDPSDPSITGYRILYGMPSAAQPALAVLVNDTGTAATSYTVGGLAPGTAYEFAVVALGGAAGTPSAASQLVTVYTTGTPTPQPPTPQPPPPHPTPTQSICR